MSNINVVSVRMVKEKNLEVDCRRFNSPEVASDILRKYIGDSDREVCVCMGLNSKNHINSISIVSIGSINSSIVHPREVFKTLILSNSASFIVGHNHPSGDSTPSREDINITLRLDECGKILGIPLLDHIIIGDNEYTSLKDKSLF